ncbi:MAG TPA: PA14 domain-containing protein [Pirellulales bacterium]
MARQSERVTPRINSGLRKIDAPCGYGPSLGRALLRIFLALIVAGASCGVVLADEDDDAPPELPAGLRAEYTAGGRSMVRVDSGVRLYAGAASVDPRLPPGDFTAHWSGKLSVIAPGVHQFHVHAGGGAVRVSIDGKKLIDDVAGEARWFDSGPIDLEYGHHALEVEFRRAADDAQIGLYWSGPRFRLEPVPERALVHDVRPAADQKFEQGRALVHGLRCAACHDLPDARPVLAAPALVKLPGNIERPWLMNWIGGPRTVSAPPAIDDTSKSSQSAEQIPPSAPPAAKPAVAANDGNGADIVEHLSGDIPIFAIDDVKFRMPGLGLSRDDARHIVSYLLDEDPKDEPHAKKEAPATKPPGNDRAGETLFYSLGCLGCHSLAGLGTTRLAGGGELYNVADKRPDDFFARWLADPAACNPTHRMPLFPLSDEERQNLAAFLARQSAAPDKKPAAADEADFGGSRERGRDLIAKHHCGSCHELPLREGMPTPEPAAVARRKISAAADWEASCLGEPDPGHARPGYRLRPEQREVVVAYLQAIADAPEPTTRNSNVAFDGARVLADRNCLGCHSRGLAAGIAAHTPAFAAAHPELSAALSTLAPPSLADVGDKLERRALLEAMTTAGDPRRKWLAIRMPRFKFAPGEAEALADWLIENDRLPPRAALAAARDLDEDTLQAAGGRLVTAEGFGCASCHQIGKSVPKQDNPAARGTDLSLVGNRIRREWFDRWVRNPARIVPRMEMPAIEIPVGGVLDERLDDQLTAVWDVLNKPGFTPPAAGAVRVVRTRNMPGMAERAAILTDVLRIEKRAYARPFVVGLANRHTVLMDLEQNRLAGWWVGDAARERSEGKRWYWQPGGTHVLAVPNRGASELTLRRDGQIVEPEPTPQFRTLLDSWQHVAGGVTFAYRLKFPAADRTPAATLRVSQRITAIEPNPESGRAGFRRRLEVHGIPAGREIQWRLLPEEVAGTLDGERFVATNGPAGEVSVRLVASTGQQISDDAGPVVRIAAPTGIEPVVVEAEYCSRLAADRYSAPLVTPASRPAATLHCVPGFDAVRLPLPPTEMPTGFAWRRDGTLMFTSLKGGAWLAPDTDGDGLADELLPLADELAAPYGLCTVGDAVDVINKNGLLRLSDFDGQGRAGRTDIIADGWGQTTDYHDWAIGPVPDDAGGYFVALPCRQDERSDAAARLRGWAVHLMPRVANDDNPRLYDVVPLCSGLRFPMGLARSRQGALFATDNQGHYNPFNELNHLVADSHYGFFNKFEARQGTPLPRQDPAIEIPHPWTRSVNGICFLNTPEQLRASTGRDVFGPWEGHLVGCEYDTRRLVRMSLERVGETYQGAAYPLSVEPADGEETFEGPIACQVAPDGALFIGNMRDSGWGAGQNTGSIVRLRATGHSPAGIAEVCAAADGFTIHFTRPVRAAAADVASYVVESYRRVPTSDYGGPDIDRRTERIRGVTLADDNCTVHLTFDDLRPGFVYEFHLKNLAGPGEVFHPAEAYYTLRTVPMK